MKKIILLFLLLLPLVGFSQSRINKNKKTNDKLSKFIYKSKKVGITLLDWNIVEGNIGLGLIGTSLRFNIYNPTKKTIKYIWFNIKGMNSFNDIVSLGKFTGIGPIEPSTSAAYYFTIAETFSVEKVKISSIKIQYMDKTFRVINNPVTMSTELLDTLEGRLGFYLSEFEKLPPGNKEKKKMLNAAFYPNKSN